MKNNRANKLVCMIIISIMCSIFVGAGCYSETTTYKESEYTEELMNHFEDMVGYPNCSNAFERQILKNLYELRDDPNLVCYWYTNNYEGRYIYQGTCVGFGIPYSTSFTQPETRAYYGSDSVVPQADPNGLYSNGVTTSATWIIVYDENGNLKPRYVEPGITVSTTKLDRRLCCDWSLPEDY